MIKAKKSLGQNFLSDERVSRRIVEAVSPAPTDIVIEIGPGTGALTQLLVNRSGLVTAVEIDRRLVEEINSLIASTNFSMIEADALKVDWNALIEQATDRYRGLHGPEAKDPRVRVVANLPYYISTPIIERLIKLRRQLFDMTLMLQKEVVDRIASPPGSREYGYLSVLVQFYCEAEKLFDVPPSSFRPVPKVWSSVVKLTVRERAAVTVSDEARLLALVGAAFAQRRKTILNNLKAAAATMHFNSPVEDAIKQAGIDPRRRAETLAVGEFAALYTALFAG